MNTADVQVIEVGVVGDIPYRDMREYARWFEKKLKNVPGVGRLQKSGLRSREIRVEILPRGVKRFQIPLRGVIRAIQARRAKCRSRRAFAAGEE